MTTKNRTESNGHAAAHHTNGASHATLHVKVSADSRQEQASEALANLARIKSELAPDRALSARERRYASKFTRIKLPFIEQAVSAAAEEGLTSFDAIQVNDTIAYERVANPVMTALRGALQALEDTVHGRHQYAAEQALAVYASLKGLVRFKNDVGTQAQVDELSRLVGPRKRSAPKAAAPAATPAAASSSDDAPTK